MSYLKLTEYEVLAIQEMGETTIDRVLPVGGLLQSFHTGAQWQTEAGVVQVDNADEYQVASGTWRYVYTLRAVRSEVVQ